MNKLISAMLISTLITTASYAEGFFDYIGLGAAMQTVDSPHFDSGTALIVNGGKNVYFDLGLEIEGALSVQQLSGKTDGIEEDGADFWSLGMYSTYIWKLGNLSIKPRVGLIYEHIDSKMNISDGDNPVPGTEKDEMGISAGIGFAYQISEQYNIYTNYTRIEDDIEHLTFGAEFKF